MNAISPASVFAIPDAADDIERGYRASVRAHHPGIDDWAMSNRVEIMRMRDTATAALRRCSDAAYPILSQVSHMGTMAALGGQPTKSLVLIRGAMETMLVAARMIQRGQVSL